MVIVVVEVMAMVGEVIVVMMVMVMVIVGEVADSAGIYRTIREGCPFLPPPPQKCPHPAHGPRRTAPRTRHSPGYISFTFTPNDTPKISQNFRYLLVALLMTYISAVPNS